MVPRVFLETQSIVSLRYSLETKCSSENHLRSNKQPIKLLYNVENKLTSILSSYNIFKILSSKKVQTALSQFNNFQKNKQLSKLLHNDVNNLTSFWDAAKVPKSFPCNSNYCITEIFTWDKMLIAYFIYHHLTSICWRTINLINFLYNDVKSLTSILSCCNGDKVVFSKKDRKAIFLLEDHV